TGLKEKPAPQVVYEVTRAGAAGRRHSNQSFLLHAPETLIARREGEITFPDDPFLSSRRARLRVEGEGIIPEQSESTNGAFVKLRQRTRLGEGEEVLCRSKRLRIRAD
ncbi:MAG: hypothetical protein ACE5HL_08090, partial [Terriglobia bacterium]